MSLWFTELVLLHHHAPPPPCVQSAQDLATKCKNFGNVFVVIEKFIDRLETKMTNVDPRVVGQHVQPLENNYLKAWTS